MTLSVGVALALFSIIVEILKAPQLVLYQLRYVDGSFHCSLAAIQ
jgi:hypothetical protein